MPLVVNEVVQVTIRGLCAGQRIMLVTAWQVQSNSFTGSLLGDLARVNDAFSLAIAGELLPTYLSCLGNDYTGSSVRSQVIHPSRSIYVEKLLSGVVGTGLSPANAPNISACVSRISDAAGRRNVSNAHLGPIPSGQYGAGLLTAGYQTTLSNWAVRWLQVAQTVAPVCTLKPVIFHRPPAPVPVTDLVTARIQIEVRDMTRRVVGRGE